MADEYTIDAKYKRDNLVAEHERYREVLREVIDAGSVERYGVHGAAWYLGYVTHLASEALGVRERGEQ